MEQQFLLWFQQLIIEFAKFGSWLTKPLPYIELSPLALFGFVGISALIAALLLRLFVGG